MASEQPMTSASASHAALGLGVARLGLHPGEGVEGRDERQVELVLEPVAGDARTASSWRGGRRRRRSGRRWARTPSVNASTTSGRSSLARSARTGLDVHDPEAGLDLDDLGAGVVPAPDEDVGGHAGLGQRRHELADVDVHAAAVALPGLGERRRVQREDGEAAHRGYRRGVNARRR